HAREPFSGGDGEIVTGGVGDGLEESSDAVGVQRVAISGCLGARRIQVVVATPRLWRCWMGQSRKQVPEVPVGARRQWAADGGLRPPMRSPGRPEPSRAVQRAFWRLIAAGITTVEAAAAVGVSSPVGVRWFRHAGGMPPLS